MRKALSLLLALSLALTAVSFAFAEPSVYTGSAKGFNSDVTVKVTIEDGKVIDLEVDDAAETYTAAGIKREDSVDKLIAAIKEAGTADGIDKRST